MAALQTTCLVGAEHPHASQDLPGLQCTPTPKLPDGTQEFPPSNNRVRTQRTHPRPRGRACGRCAPAGADGLCTARARLRGRLPGRSSVSVARRFAPARPTRAVGSGLVRRAPRHMGARAGVPWVLVRTPGMGGGSGAHDGVACPARCQCVVGVVYVVVVAVCM